MFPDDPINSRASMKPFVMKGRLWGKTSLFIGAQLDNLEWAHLPGAMRDG
jgi:hypothetical protein